MAYRLTTVMAAALAVAGAATLAAAQTGARGYLQPDAFDILAVLPPAPATGDARDAADRAIFLKTRELVGTPRWDMATSDVKTVPAAMFGDFACALGITLTPETAPRTAALLARADRDTGRSSARGKDFYQRKRPYLIDSGRTCQPGEDLNGSADYPSGHTTHGWTWASLLAELAPDRATPILARGRAFGESRIVCGVHNASAVEAGRVTAAATLAAVHGNAEFASDLAAARTELDALRSDPATPHPAAGDVHSAKRGWTRNASIDSSSQIRRRRGPKPAPSIRETIFAAGQLFKVTLKAACAPSVASLVSAMLIVPG